MLMGSKETDTTSQLGLVPGIISPFDQDRLDK